MNTKYAAINDKSDLPFGAQPKISDINLSKTELFNDWKTTFTDTVSSFPRYFPLLRFPPKEGWTEFKRINAGIDESTLQLKYIESQRKLWNFMLSCFGPNTVSKMREDMTNNPENNLPELLDFDQCNQDSEYHINCYGLMRKLTDRFQMKSGWRIDSLINQLCSLRYTTNKSPDTFIQEFHTIHRQLSTLVPNYPKMPDELLAHELLAKIPKELHSIKSQFLNPEKPPTLSAVEGALLNWWQSEQPDSHSISNNKSNTKGNNESAYTVVQTKQNFRNFKRKNRNSNENDKEDSKNNEKQHYNLAIIEDKTYQSDEEKANLANTGTFIPQSRHAIMDSGATGHFTGRKDLLKDLKDINTLRVTTINGDKYVKEMGKLHLNSRVTLGKVKLIPNSTFTLISTSQICDTGCQVLFTKEGSYVVPPNTFSAKLYKGKTVFEARREGNLYVYNIGGKSDHQVLKEILIFRQIDKIFQRRIFMNQIKLQME